MLHLRLSLLLTPVSFQAIKFLQNLRAELKANYTTKVTIPEAEYKKAVAELEAEKARFGLQKISVEPRKSVSLKDLTEG